jgi:hypothetical protein
LAVILGVLLVLRKLDVQRREPKDFPHVSAPRFEAWRASQTAAYRFGSFACLIKLVVDFAFNLLARKYSLSPVWLWIGTFTIDMGWLGAMVWTLLRSRSARKLSHELGIELR